MKSKQKKYSKARKTQSYNKYYLGANQNPVRKSFFCWSTQHSTVQLSRHIQIVSLYSKCIVNRSQPSSIKLYRTLPTRPSVAAKTKHHNKIVVAENIKSYDRHSLSGTAAATTTFGSVVVVRRLPGLATRRSQVKQIWRFENCAHNRIALDCSDLVKN